MNIHNSRLFYRREGKKDRGKYEESKYPFLLSSLCCVFYMLLLLIQPAIWYTVACMQLTFKYLSKNFLILLGKNHDFSLKMTRGIKETTKPINTALMAKGFSRYSHSNEILPPRIRLRSAPFEVTFVFSL